MQKKLRVRVLQPITEPGPLNLPDTANAVVLQNVGTSKAYIDGFTLKPDATLQFGSQNDQNIVEFPASVQFETGLENRLEIIEISLVNC